VVQLILGEDKWMRHTQPFHHAQELILLPLSGHQAHQFAIICHSVVVIDVVALR